MVGQTVDLEAEYGYDELVGHEKEEQTGNQGHDMSLGNRAADERMTVEDLEDIQVAADKSNEIQGQTER